MFQIVVSKTAKSAIIAGHGVKVPLRFQVTDGVYLDPALPHPSPKQLEAATETFREYAAIFSMLEIATFSIEIIDHSSAKALVNRVWNALWLFHLASLGCNSPTFSLYACSTGTKQFYCVANRNLVVSPLEAIPTMTIEQMEWMRSHYTAFCKLIKDTRFATAMRYFGNSHYLFDLDARIMLLWAGIEGLLNVDGELRRRIAMHAAMMNDGSPAQKSAHFASVKKAYDLRSKVVHGSKPTVEKLKEGYETASAILLGLLRKCVELGRVPTPEELDRLAIAQTVS